MKEYVLAHVLLWTYILTKHIIMTEKLLRSYSVL